MAGPTVTLQHQCLRCSTPQGAELRQRRHKPASQAPQAQLRRDREPAAACSPAGFEGIEQREVSPVGLGAGRGGGGSPPI